MIRNIFRPFLILMLFSFVTGSVFASGDEGHHDPVHDLLIQIGITILTASFVAYLGNLAKQPLILAYLATGVILGPNIGFGIIQSEANISTISEIGLVLLLFMIGMEIDLKKIKASGKSLILTGILQFAICAALGFGFFSLIGYTIGGEPKKYDLFYMSVCCGISSTAIVVKLLYSKFELDTLAGRITLGILVFQDIWAIVILGVQPNLADPKVLDILASFGKAGILVFISVMISKYILPKLFGKIAKIPEMMLLVSLGWCLFVVAVGNLMGLSAEMGALIAGVSISTFPYNLDVIAKVITMRDFFITIFFVSLGMKIPNPLADLSILASAFVAAGFLIVSRFLSIYPVLFSLNNGNRVSLLPAINLANISEFSLVIAALGFQSGHIDQRILSIVIFVFVITSILAPYMISFNGQIQIALTKLVELIGLKDKQKYEEPVEAKLEKDVALLGFFRVASSFVSDLQEKENKEKKGEEALKEKIVVVDFNQSVHQKLKAIDVPVLYGDIAHMDTLHHIGLHDAKVIISTIPDNILVGTSNQKLIKQIQELAPHSKIIVTAESPVSALKMYEEGADYVFLPRLLASEHLIPIVEDLLEAHEGHHGDEHAEGHGDKHHNQLGHTATEAKHRMEKLKKEQIAWLKSRQEIIQ
jgi:Kef-type K+ transport system membrane component KefB